MSKPKRAPRKRKSSALPAPEVEDVGDQVTEVHKEESLDEFLQENMLTSTQEANGMPSLEWLGKTFKTKSARIRYLVTKGFKTKDIAKHLGVKYQHVRNVSTTTLKRGPNESFDPNNPLPKFELPIKKPDEDKKPVED